MINLQTKSAGESLLIAELAWKDMTGRQDSMKPKAGPVGGFEDCEAPNGS